MIGGMTTVVRATMIVVVAAVLLGGAGLDKVGRPAAVVRPAAAEVVTNDLGPDNIIKKH
jgi:hypothetical protein